MNIINYKKGEILAEKGSRAGRWYLLLEGRVCQKFGFTEIILEKDAVAGILEYGRLKCSYIAVSDGKAAVFDVKDVPALCELMERKKELSPVFTEAALKQRRQMFLTYSGLEEKSRHFYSVIQSVYHEYKKLCSAFSLEERGILGVENFKPLTVKYKAERWELRSSYALNDKYLKEYVNFLRQETDLSVGMIMSCMRQMQRVSAAIMEMDDYLLFHKDFLFAESENDIFSLYFDLAVRAGLTRQNMAEVHKRVKLICRYAQKIRLYDIRMIEKRVRQYENYDFMLKPKQKEEIAQEEVSEKAVSAEIGKSVLEEASEKAVSAETGKSVLEEAPEKAVSMDTENHASEEVPEETSEKNEAEDFSHYMDHILSYAGYEKGEAAQISSIIKKFHSVPDKSSTDGEAYQLRKQIVKVFYEIYKRVFFETISRKEELPVYVQMFLNFGFLDVELTGEENAHRLYDLAKNMQIFESEYVYTIYRWLLAVYEGKKEPSKNEFDMDYAQYVADMLRNKQITKEESGKLLEDQRKKVEYELDNMFPSANRAVYGRITSFCPVLFGENLISSIENMMVSAEKLESELNKLRGIDYSAFYRERVFSDVDKNVVSEFIKVEVLPDMILMPNAGTKAMMWQELSGARRDTPARFIFPIFTAVSLEDTMIETVGRFRWEICRREQGARWNDIKEKSLTSEYCDYLQFYKKNSSLSADAKEKIKKSLTRCRNNFREVFATDYFNWVKYEAKGVFRLNRPAREIIVNYCPFVQEIRSALVKNPMYQNLFAKVELSNTKKKTRVNGVFERYRKAGGEITPELQENLDFYEK